MKIRILILSLLFIFSFGFLEAQKLVVSGYVQDASSCEALSYSNVYIPNLRLATTSNAFGFFSLTIAKKPISDSIAIVASFIGYKTVIKQIKLTKNKKNISLNFKLEQGVLLSEVIVKADFFSQQINNIGEISIKDIKMLPTLLGETDLLKMYQYLPGVQATTEGASNFIVRGGSPDQNLILVDGVPIYFISHFQGLFSVFDADAINRAQLIKDGFPARYGGRLSSILNIRLKEGDLRKYHKKLSLGIISTKLMINGPIKKNKSSFFISLRRSNLDLPMRLIAKVNTADFLSTYTFYDTFFKINKKFKHQNRLFFSAYYGIDRLYFLNRKESNTTISWPSSDKEISTFSMKNTFGTFFTNIRYYKAISSNLFTNLRIGYMRYGYTNSTETDQLKIKTNELQYLNETNFSTEINDFSANLHFDYNATENHTINFGFSSLSHFFNLGNYSQKKEGILIGNTQTSFKQKQIQTNESFFYLEDKWKINTYLNLQYGLHLSTNYIQKGKIWFWALEPRLSLSFILNKNNKFDASFTQMKQYLHLLSSSAITMPFDIWVPANKAIPPENATEYALTYKHIFPTNKIFFSASTYYKNTYHLIDFKEGESFSLGALNWANKVENDGQGTAYGMEFLLKKESEKFNFWISYTYSRSLRTFSNLNGGKIFPYKYDRPHSIAIVGIYSFSKKYSISGNWIFNSGHLTSIATDKFPLINETNTKGFTNKYSNPAFNYIFNSAYVYPEKNNFRLPNYHRLDISFNINKKRPKGRVEWNLGIYNVYNRKNPFFYYYNTNNSGKLKLYRLSIFPIIPFFSYHYIF